MAIGRNPITQARTAAQSPYNVGVFYFPGWSTPGGGPQPADPWGLITPYPDRIPTKGAYDETQQSIVDAQLREMQECGIKFVALDWYWDGTEPKLTHWLTAYLASAVSPKPKFCLLFANATFSVPKDGADWADIYAYWIANYTGNANYYKIGGKPVAMLFDVATYVTNMGGLEDATTGLFNASVAEHTAHDSFGFYWVGCDYATVAKTATIGQMGCQAMSMYNVVLDYNGDTYTPPATLDYAQINTAHLSFYSYALANFGGPHVLLPVSAGYDPTPWNGENTVHAIPTDGEFKAHLLYAKGLIDADPARTQRTVLLYAWNEFGEAGFVEPTVGYSRGRLQAIKEVFGDDSRRAVATVRLGLGMPPVVAEVPPPVENTDEFALMWSEALLWGTDNLLWGNA